MRISLILLFLFVGQLSLRAQTFPTKARVEYEVKTNLRKQIGEGTWAEMMKENLPNFKTAYYQYQFDNNKSLFKLQRFDETQKIPEWFKADDENCSWYQDHESGTIKYQKSIAGAAFVIQDSLPKLSWQITQENMMIAGFSCRKAVTKLFDSVYVFAFYSEEIPISGGPCTVNGLPGLVLGMTIPRLHTSWIATRVDLTPFDAAAIKAPQGKKVYSQLEYQKYLQERTKEWEQYYEDKNQLKMMLWNSML